MKMKMGNFDLDMPITLDLIQAARACGLTDDGRCAHCGRRAAVLIEPLEEGFRSSLFMQGVWHLYGDWAREDIVLIEGPIDPRDETGRECPSSVVMLFTRHRCHRARPVEEVRDVDRTASEDGSSWPSHVVLVSGQEAWWLERGELLSDYICFRVVKHIPSPAV